MEPVRVRVTGATAGAGAWGCGGVRGGASNWWTWVDDAYGICVVVDIVGWVIVVEFGPWLVTVAPGEAE